MANRLAGIRYQALALGLAGALTALSCTTTGGGSPGTGGSGGGAGGSGGSSGTGGATATGGTITGSGGSGSGGASNTGGTTTSSTVGAGGTAGSVPARGGGAGGSGGVGTGGVSSGGAGGAGSGGTSNTGGTITTSTAGTGGTAGSSSARGGGAGGAGGVGTGGVGSGGSATGGTTTGGTGGGTGGDSTRGQGGTVATGTGGGGGTTDCAGRALSLSSNGTASDSDSAYAHVEIDMKTDLPIGNGNRTFEFWAYIKTTDWVGEKNQIFYYGGSASNGSFGLDFGTNNVTGSTTNHATLNPFTGSDIRDDSGKDLGINSSTDQWVHIAMTWDGTVLTTYINGLPKITAQGAGTATTLNTAQSVLMIGCNPTNKNCFGGTFDEFRVWNVARLATDIKNNYNKPMVGNETGLVGYWKFGESSGTTTADAVTTSGHTAHAGTLMADTVAHNPTFVTPTAPLPLVCL